METIQDLIAHQEKKLLALAREIVPHLTSDDIMQPNDFPELENHPIFRYEEGILTGLKTAQSALAYSIKSEFEMNFRADTMF